MFGIVHYEAFVLTGILLNLTPGSDTIYILSRSIAQGRRAGIYSVLGISCGCGVHTILAAVGLSAILAQSAMAFMAVKVAGALYLGYLGVMAIWGRNGRGISLTEETMSIRETFFQGMMTNLLNPKVALFFLSFLPQFIDSQNPYGIIPFLILGATFFVTGTLWCLILVWCSASITGFLRQRSQLVRQVNRVCGGIYLLLGMKVLVAER